MPAFSLDSPGVPLAWFADLEVARLLEPHVDRGAQRHAVAAPGPFVFCLCHGTDLSMEISFGLVWTPASQARTILVFE